MRGDGNFEQLFPYAVVAAHHRQRGRSCFTSSGIKTSKAEIDKVKARLKDAEALHEERRRNEKENKIYKK
jgi:hypothetical protein